MPNRGRERLPQALGVLGSERALPALLAQLQDDSADVRSSVAQALGGLGCEEALPMLLAQMRDDDPAVRKSVAQALGDLGRKDAASTLIGYLNDDSSAVRSSVLSALGKLESDEAIFSVIEQLWDDKAHIRSDSVRALNKINNDKMLPLLEMLFKQDDSKIVKAVAAIGLLSFGDDYADGYSYLHDAIGDLKHHEEWFYTLNYLNFTSYIDRDVDLQTEVVDGIGLSPSDATKKLLLMGFNEKYPVPVQIKWLESFVASNVIEALPLIYHLCDSNDNKIKQAAQSAVVRLEIDYSKLLTMVGNSELGIPFRLDALTTLVENYQRKTIPDLLRLLKTDEKLYGRKIWRMLGELKALEAKEMLEACIEEIRQGYANWRNIRDSEPKVPEGETKEKNETWKKWKQELDASKPAYAAHYARALARIDSETGIKLLEHEIADIRKGAWYGLASLADINLVKQLTDLRLRSHDKPLLRHAAYRAIDLSLTTIQHNNKPEDLQALEAWYPTLKQQEMQQEEVKTEDELSITPRVDWTIHLISYNLKAKAELQRRYQVFVAEQKKKTNE